MRRFTTFKIDHPEDFRKRFFNWAGNLPISCVLDSNDYAGRYPHSFARHSYELLAGTGCLKNLTLADREWQKALDKFLSESNDWIFGHVGYDLKNEIEDLTSSHPDRIDFPLIYFFVPEYVFIIKKNILEIGWHSEVTNSDDVASVIKEIITYPLPEADRPSVSGINEVIPETDYLRAVEKIMEHIRKGDIYEVNFCLEFLAEKAIIDPVSTWIRLIEESPTPFSCFYRINDKYLLCASPERFLKKTGNMIYSQPIKGTSARGTTLQDDRFAREALRNDPKERAENIMITDLVRNDLSKIASKGSVKVNELCGIYPFPRVYQMQSDISAELSGKTDFSRILESTFPMGSMTGAPKMKAMEIIEQYEKSRRGLYSGTVGYFTPGLDFDFNVVIRSIQYNRAEECLSFMVGGAITNQSIPVREYQECMLKAGAVFKVLGLESHLSST